MDTYRLLPLLYSVALVLASKDSDVLAQLTVLVNETVELPCDLSTRGVADMALIVLWYRGVSPGPFYSYDLRQSGGRHWSDETVFGQRAHFDLKSNPPSLKVAPVRPSDQDTYRCRVDYEKGPSRTSTIHLSVIVPPSPAVVMDESGAMVEGSAGPYLEGGRVVLTCKTMGGRPSPTLVWLRGGRVVEDSYTVDHRGQVRNLLHLDHLGRHLLDATYTCRASNNNITMPLDTSVTINMTLAPLTISLLKVGGPQEYVSAGITEELECASYGSRPDPVISWWRDGRRIPNPSAKQVRLVNATVSTLRLVPRPADHGVVFTCRVENPSLPSSVLEDSYKLNVHYIPKVDLHMGLGLSPKEVKEGSDVFFECRVTSNPKFYKISWVHEGDVIKHNVTAGVIVSNQSLVLQKVGRDRAGRYYCRATNLHGEGVSKPIEITIMYTPVCSPGQRLEYQVAHHDTANITCRVDAVPSNVTFRWSFNASGSVLELGDGRAASWGTTSILPYTPTSPGDYGLLLCAATNEIGTQHLPCIINVTAAKPPDLLEGCVIRNQTTHSVFVTCKGVPTVLPRTFTMEVRNSEDLRLVTKVSNSTPHFVATGLDPGTAYTLHVAVRSPMGDSTPIKLEAFTVKTAEKRMGISEPEAETITVAPLVAVVAGVGVAIIITFIIILSLAIKHCPGRRGENVGVGGGYAPPHAHGSLTSDASPKETISTFSRPSPASEERNPDVIPLKEECDYQLEELRVPSCQVVGGMQTCPPLTTNLPPALRAPVPSVPSLGSLVSCPQGEWDAYYHHHHRLHHHHHHHQQPPPTTSYIPLDGTEMLSVPEPHPASYYLPETSTTSVPIYTAPPAFLDPTDGPSSSSPLLQQPHHRQHLLHHHLQQPPPHQHHHLPQQQLQHPSPPPPQQFDESLRHESSV